MRQRKSPKQSSAQNVDNKRQKEELAQRGDWWLPGVVASITVILTFVATVVPVFENRRTATGFVLVGG